VGDLIAIKVEKDDPHFGISMVPEPWLCVRDGDSNIATLAFWTAGNVSGRYRSVSKFNTAKPTHVDAS